MLEGQSFSGNIPENYDRLLGPYLFEPYALDLAERLKKNLPNSILEIACGTGRLTSHLLNLLPGKGKLVATDISNAMLEVAKRKLHDKRITWLEADAQNIPFEDNSFDCVICQFGVMFFPDKKKAYSEAFRLLKSGGNFLFNTWASLQYNLRPSLINDVIEEVFQEKKLSFFEEGPFSYYDTQIIQNELQEAGFSKVVIEPVEKQITYNNEQEYINGFIDGTPISTFLSEKDPSIQKAFKEKALKASREKFGEDLSASMLAYVCLATKK